MTRPIHFPRGLRIPPGGSHQMIMREGDTAVIGLDLRATKRAGARFDRDRDPRTSRKEDVPPWAELAIRKAVEMAGD